MNKVLNFIGNLVHDLFMCFIALIFIFILCIKSLDTYLIEVHKINVIVTIHAYNEFSIICEDLTKESKK